MRCLKLHTILSDAMKFCAALLYPMQDVNHFFIRHILNAYSWPSIATGSASVALINQTVLLLGCKVHNGCACAEHVHTLFLVIIFQTTEDNNYFHSVYVVLSILSELEMI